MPTPQSDSYSSDSWPKLLVSVASLNEARLVLEHGVEWIDLKNPAAGALGAAEITTATEVANQLQLHPYRSLALGELSEVLQRKHEELQDLAAGFAVAKIGLKGAANTHGWQEHWLQIQQELNSTHLVPVIYADWKTCQAPPPDEVIELGNTVRSEYLLIDTCTKDGRTLLDFLSPQRLQKISASLQATRLVLAGSLNFASVQLIQEQVDCFAIGVRGAVCKGGREARIAPDKLAEWTKFFRQKASRVVS